MSSSEERKKSINEDVMGGLFTYRQVGRCKRLECFPGGGDGESLDRLTAPQ